MLPGFSCVTCNARKATCVLASSRVSENFGFIQFPSITPGTQRLTHQLGRQGKRIYKYGRAAACDSWMARRSPHAYRFSRGNLLN